MSRKHNPMIAYTPMSFTELCETFHVTDDERDRLAWHLATLRAKATYDALKGRKP